MLLQLLYQHNLLKNLTALFNQYILERINGVYFKIFFDEHLSFDKDQNIENITDKLNRWLEEKIIKNPDQWIWSHNRWKL